MTRAIRLDVHAHLVPVDEERLAAIEGVAFDREGTAMVIDGHRVGMKPLFRPERLIAWMDENRVAEAWISAPPPLYRQHLRGEAAWQWAAYINDGLAGIAAASKGRLRALMHLPVEDPETAAALAGELAAAGHRRFAMPCGAGDARGLSDAAFEPLWRALDAASAFVFLHPGECADGRLKAFYLSNLVGNPYESTVAIAHLVFGGVLDRFPGIEFCFAHGGGLAPMAAGRLQRGYDTDRPGIDKAVTPPETALRRLRVDCICHGEPAIMLAEAVFGEDNVVFGSDWPFPMGIVEPERQMGGHDAARLDRLFDANPARLIERLERKGKDKP
jgi:aminocarboxymuconate-semialdehyde decarboxylase